MQGKPGGEGARRKFTSSQVGNVDTVTYDDETGSVMEMYEYDELEAAH